MTHQLSDAHLCLIGYGAQGRAEALNLRRSQVTFSLGLRPGGTSWNKAVEDGFAPLEFNEALRGATHVALNLPDQIQARFFQEHLKGLSLKALIFAHGFNTYFKLIPLVPGGPAHLLIAPKGAASGLIEFYGTPTALPAILAVENSSEGDALLEFGRRYALAIGCHPKGLVTANFKDETVCDLFSEQVLLCGGVSSLLRQSYEVLVEGGYNPETAYFETLYELKLIVDLLWKSGINGMRARISPTARYGDVTRGDRVINESVKAEMRKILLEIESGSFAKEFLNKINSQEFDELQKSQAKHPLEKIGTQLREKLFS